MKVLVVMASATSRDYALFSMFLLKGSTKARSHTYNHTHWCSHTRTATSNASGDYSGNDEMRGARACRDGSVSMPRCTPLVQVASGVHVKAMGAEEKM